MIPKVTVLMPSYNVAAYLDVCMQSVINQSLKDIEILCIDAGSTDGTVEKLQAYAQKDNRIRIIHSERKSYGYQINLGVCEARGYGLSIVETDDYIEKNALEEMYEIMLKYNLDMVKANYSSFVDIRNVRYIIPEKIVSNSVLKEKCNRVCNPQNEPWFFSLPEFVWNGMFRRGLLKDNNIRLNETNGAAFQDKGLHVQSFYYAKRVMIIDKYFYFYRRDNSLSSVYNTKAFDNVTKEYDFIANFLKDKKGALDLRTLYFWKFVRYISDAHQILYRPFYVEGIRNNYEMIVSVLDEFKNSGIKMFDNVFENDFLYDLLMENKNDYIQYIQRYAHSLLKKHKCWIESLKGKEIIVFGASNVGQMLCVLFEINGISVKMICDNDSKKWGNRFGNIMIYSPEKIKELEEKTIIIACMDFYDRIVEQLLSMSVDAQDIIVYRSTLNTAMSVCAL